MIHPTLRPPAVAGMFYPGDAETLAATVATLLGAAKPVDVQAKALIVPHAGYIYSGPVAASAFATLRPRADTIERVILFGPAHRAAVPGLATTTATVFETPLGSVPVDTRAVAAAALLPQVEVSDAAHALEHSLEVQLPFLQMVLNKFSIAPFVVGGASGRDVAEVMELLWGGADTLIVVSSDLSHYHAYAAAQRLDRQTADEILHLSPLADYDQACGAAPINGLVEMARRRGLAPTLLDLRNSGDTAGDKSRVVGYSAFAFAAASHDG